MNLVLLTEGTGQGVRGRKTNVSRVYDLLVENGNQRINLEAGFSRGALIMRVRGTRGRGHHDKQSQGQDLALDGGRV